MSLVSFQASAADGPFVYGLPGKPPVFLTVLQYVAAEAGFFKKYGVDVRLQPFESGLAATRAAASGDIDFAASTTSVAIELAASKGAPLVGLYGMENTDWLIASNEPGVKGCHDLVGKSIAVDAIGGARSLALQQMITPYPCNLQMGDVQQVPLGSKTRDAMISGQLKTGVLHLDDLAAIEDRLAKRLSTVITLKRVRPVSHYELFVTRKDKLERNYDTYVRVIAAHIEAEAYMRNYKNLARVAEIATITGHGARGAEEALKRYLEFEFWPNGHDGLDQRKVEAEIASQLSAKDLKSAASPPTYQTLVDRNVYQKAKMLVAGM